MRTDAKDLALSVFQRQKERSEWPPGVRTQRCQETAGAREGDPPPPPPPGMGMAATQHPGSIALKVYNSELIHRKWAASIEHGSCRVRVPLGRLGLFLNPGRVVLPRRYATISRLLKWLVAVLGLLVCSFCSSITSPHPGPLRGRA